MSDDWKRIAGLQVEEDGKIAAVWLGHNKISDVVTLYDACKFNNEVPVVIAEGLNARGRWIPIAWNEKQKAVADKMLERGCSMLYDPVKETDFDAEMVSREIQERMRTGRFKVEKRVSEWLTEFNTFREVAGRVPTAAFPLMAATRYAIASLSFARRMKQPAKINTKSPRIAIL